MMDRIGKPPGLLRGAERLDVGEVAVDPTLPGLVRSDDDVERIKRRALGDVPTLHEALLRPAPEHLARPVELGAVTSALAEAVHKPGAPGEAPAETRMRQIASTYLELRLEVAAGLARISIG